MDMMLLTSSWLLDIPLLFVITVFLLYKYFTRKFDYWEKRGIPYIKPIPFFGNAFNAITFKKTMALFMKDIYYTMDEPFFGIFILDDPFLIVKSPQLIRQILIKDFNYFTDRTILAPDHDEIIANIMFMQKSPEWKKVRPLMTRIFSTGNIKGMFPIIENVGTEMNNFIKKNLGQLEARDICTKYATDVIAKCAFAIHAHCFDREDSDFREIAKRFFGFSWKNAINQITYFFLQNWANLLRLKFVEPKDMKYMTDVFWQAIAEREKTNVKGNDLIDIIIDMRKNEELCKEINFEGDKVVAQAVMFFMAGSETTSTAISFVLYELCLNPPLQDRLRSEILNGIEEHGGVTYEGVQKMKLLDMCILEILRKYNTVPMLDRRCNADYKIPGTDIIIEKGTPVMIPTWGLHYDETYFADPNKYDPDRFQDRRQYNVDGLRFLPFGEGPRICIGERFGTLTTKVGLVKILSEFVVERGPNTPVPLEFQMKSLATKSRTGLYLVFRELHPKENNSCAL